MAPSLRLGLNLGYWAGGPPPGATELVAEAERLGFDSMWTAEAYGSDVLTPLAWWGSSTERMQLGTAIAQISARAPAATAMAAMTMDHLSAAGSSSASASRDRRSSRAGTASRSRSRWRGCASTSGSCANDLGAAGPGHKRRPALPAAAARTAPDSASR